MPDLVMHYHFGRSLHKELNEKIKGRINNLYLYDFANAGPDPFFFVKFWKSKVNKESLEFGNYMHNAKTKDFFIELISICRDNKDMFSYLAGFIGHYSLDVYAHPYIFHKTGKYIKEKPETLVYRGLHTKLERAIDSSLIRDVFKTEARKFKIHKNVLKLRKLDINLKDSFNKLYFNVFSKVDGFNHVNSSVKDQRRFYKFIYDPFGIKQKLLEKIDNGTSTLDFTVLSYYKKEINDVDIFNLNKTKWNNPLDNKIESNDSFYDLFDKAIVLAKKLIEISYDVIFNNKNHDLNKYFLNLSYLHGLDCKIEKEMKYFNNIFN